MNEALNGNPFNNSPSRLNISLFTVVQFSTFERSNHMAKSALNAEYNSSITKRGLCDRFTNIGMLRYLEPGVEAGGKRMKGNGYAGFRSTSDRPDNQPAWQTLLTVEVVIHADSQTACWMRIVEPMRF